MELRLMFLHDIEANYIVRMCMLVEDAVAVVPGSEERLCEECERPVWYDLNQVIPMPDDRHIEREVVLCLKCAALHMSLDEGIEWESAEKGESNGE